ncbi:hypothetical protein RJ639_001206 [Escallonia herrerae]|uniref:NAC domain-containing protein n=1 Tax=Escallonia herrerae TaxID=1293975 RepID=A0AA88XBD5_9ASTE|nr:hypothetical protein RJ639_001206 [Escallonia herrerae]
MWFFSFQVVDLERKSASQTEEELFKSLRKIIDGSPLPGNVITDVNPYQYKPSHLPEGKKDSENGFWKVKGKACEIFTNSTITGWRTTLEFYEGQAPHGPRIDWLIQEYGITYKGVGNNSKPKGFWGWWVLGGGVAFEGELGFISDGSGEGLTELIKLVDGGEDGGLGL